MKEEIEDELIKNILKDFKADELSDDFTDRIMKKIEIEQPYQKKIKAYNPNAFIPAFVLVFSIIIIAVLSISENNGISHQNYYLFSDFLSRFKINLPDYTVHIKQFLTNSAIFKTLPFSVILLAILDLLLSKKYQ